MAKKVGAKATANNPGKVKAEKMGTATAEANDTSFRQVLLAIRNLNRFMTRERDPGKLIERACANVTELLGYFHLWIALLDEASGAVTALAASGFDRVMEPLREKTEPVTFPVCIASARHSDTTVVVDDPLRRCPGCVLAKACADRAGLSRRLHYEGKTYGLLVACVTKRYAQNAEEVALFDEMVDSLAFAIHENELITTLRAGNEQFRGIVEQANDILYRQNIKTELFEYVSPRVQAVLGFTPAEILGMGFEEQKALIHPDDLPDLTTFVADLVKADRQGAKYYERKFRMRNKQGEYRWIRGIYSVSRDANGAPGVIVGTLQDITEHKNAEDVLQYNQLLLNTTEELSGVGGWEWLLDTKTMTWTPGTYRIHEFDPGSLIPGSPEHIKASLSCYYVGDREKVQNAFQRCVESGESYDLECRFTTLQGRELWVRTTGHPVVEGGRIVKIVGNLQDITQRKQAEDTLIESRRYLRTLLEKTVDGFWVVDMDGNFTDVNDSYCTMTGYSRDEILGKHFRDLDTVESHAVTMARWERIIESGSELFETQHRRKDGSIIPLDVSITYDQEKGGRFICFCRDLTERYQWEQDLGLARFSLDHASVAILWIDSEGKITYANQEAMRMLGYSREQLLSIPIWEIDPTLSQHGFEKLWISMGNGEPFHFESICRYKNGDTIPVYISVRQGEFQGVRLLFGFFSDITERKQAAAEHQKLQAELIQAQKMESVGRLAGGVAHDFNNMLGVILGYTEIALQQVDPAQALYDDLTDIHTAAMRSADLTRQLLAFARKQTITPKVLDLNETLSGMHKMLLRLIGEDVELLWIPGKDLWAVKMDPSQIDQILANLCLNARDAIVDIGKVTIETRNITLDERFTASHSGVQPGDYVLLAVRDTGRGMDQETLDHIYEPFFTTKTLGKGTGLGLATVYGIVNQNNGFIIADSKPGQGTVFTIYFPRYMDKAERPAETALVPVSPSTSKTILLVEDELAILKMTTKMLERLDYTVLAAGTPTEAFQLVKDFSSPIHLLLTDLVMPEMNGRDLAQKVLAIRPELKCLFMSGYTANVITSQEMFNGDAHFIQKPFSNAELAAKVREALG
jgi:two-component system, cell cycle sensor histidine kinase and response regulator CckA